MPVSGAAKLYYTFGYQTRDASSAAFARGGIGSDDIPSRNSATMYPDGFVPFINGDIEDRYMTVGYKRQIGEWNADFSQTYGYNKLKYNISNTLNASIANYDLLHGGAGAARPRSTPVASRSRSSPPMPTSAASSPRGERHERRLRCRVPARELPDLRR